MLADPAKAAAIKVYVTYWAQAQRWIKDHPQEWLKAYYEDNQGLDAADGRWLIRNAGTPVIPTSWTKAIAAHQQTIDLLSAEEDQPDTKAQDLWDLRYQHVAGDAYAASGRLAVSATLDRPLAADDAVVLTVDERPRRRRLGPGPRRRFAGALGPLLLLAAWAVGSWTGFLSPQTLSPPWTVVDDRAAR